ncbi:MAG: hypothetical protein ACYCWW_03000 [Deltaproteobacteria bacterium]
MPSSSSSSSGRCALPADPAGSPLGAAALRTLSALAVVAGLALVASCGDPSSPGDAGTVPPAFAPTFTNINANVFQPSCANFSACHRSGAGPTVGNLDLKTDPYTALLGDGGTGVPASDYSQGSIVYHYEGMLLVKPGDPENSLLFRKVSESPQQCQLGAPQSDCPSGSGMPSAGLQLSPGVIEAIREWIANGAKND